MGNIIMENGIEAHPDKIAAITDMPPPRNRAVLLQFLGMATI